MGNNPVSMVDPDGDAFFSLIALGAFVNYAIQGFSGNINSTGDVFLSLGIGGVAGAMGAVSAGISVSGAIPDAAFGAGSGAATGGVSGGLNSILNDDVSFGQGAGIGALSGGILGAITGGISGYINNSKAIGAETYNSIGRGSESLESTVPYSADYAKSIFKNAYGDIPGYILDIKTKEIPSVLLKEGFYFDPGYNLREAGGKILNSNYGFTETSGFWLPGGRQFSTMYLFKPAFSSKNQLISTLGHESYHSTLLFNGIADPLRHHASIRIWQQLAERNLGLKYYDYGPRSLNKLMEKFRVSDLMYMPKYKF